MILDRLDRLERWRSLHPLLGAACDWLAHAPLASLPVGRVDIQGEELFGIVQEGPSRAAGRFETHRVYADIQINLAGGERMAWWPEPTGAIIEQPNADAWFHDDPAQPAPVVDVPAGHCAIFLPGEAHLPLLHPASGPVHLRKCVLKLRW
jgi:YhcH/YjgK/YiaL family protein